MIRLPGHAFIFQPLHAVQQAPGLSGILDRMTVGSRQAVRPEPGMIDIEPMIGEMMSKSQDAKKSTKKEPAKTMKEKKEAKKVKKEERLRQQ